jgi:hypothetical protein
MLVLDPLGLSQAPIDPRPTCTSIPNSAFSRLIRYPFVGIPQLRVAADAAETWYVSQADGSGTTTSPERRRPILCRGWVLHSLWRARIRSSRPIRVGRLRPLFCPQTTVQSGGGSPDDQSDRLRGASLYSLPWTRPRGRGFPQSHRRARTVRSHRLDRSLASPLRSIVRWSAMTDRIVRERAELRAGFGTAYEHCWTYSLRSAPS